MIDDMSDPKREPPGHECNQSKWGKLPISVVVAENPLCYIKLISQNDQDHYE